MASAHSKPELVREDLFLKLPPELRNMVSNLVFASLDPIFDKPIAIRGGGKNNAALWAKGIYGAPQGFLKASSRNPGICIFTASTLKWISVLLEDKKFEPKGIILKANNSSAQTLGDHFDELWHLVLFIHNHEKRNMEFKLITHKGFEDKQKALVAARQQIRDGKVAYASTDRGDDDASDCFLRLAQPCESSDDNVFYRHRTLHRAVEEALGLHGKSFEEKWSEAYLGIEFVALVARYVGPTGINQACQDRLMNLLSMASMGTSSILETEDAGDHHTTALGSGDNTPPIAPTTELNDVESRLLLDMILPPVTGVVPSMNHSAHAGSHALDLSVMHPIIHPAAQVSNNAYKGGERTFASALRHQQISLSLDLLSSQQQLFQAQNAAAFPLPATERADYQTLPDFLDPDADYSDWVFQN